MSKFIAFRNKEVYDDYLIHYGVKGMKWGVRRTPEELGHTKKGRLTNSNNPKELSDWMKKSITYSKFTTLKSAEQVRKSKKGSCHDQVMFELEELKSMGYNPKAKFLIEYDNKTGKGGMTHSFVYFRKNGKTYWLENAWGGREGLHEYDSISSIIDDIKRRHKNNEFGDSSKYSKLEFSDFGNHKSGETLQELVDIALK